MAYMIGDDIEVDIDSTLKLTFCEINMLDESNAVVEPGFDMKTRFMDGLNSMIQDKASNCATFSREKYFDIIEEVKAAKTKQKKESVDYRRIRKYDVIVVDGTEKLIAPVTKENRAVLYYVHTEELFDILHETHLKIGHGGRTRMEKEVHLKYKNITKAAIKLYLDLCKPCQTKLSNPKKGLVSKPLLFNELNSRCQVDLIDMQSNPDRQYKFILNYQDHLTKFILLRPLKSKTAAEVAYQLLDIFTIIGAPSVLQSDNGKEFVSHVINELKSMWPELKLVHGKPRHSQSQGSVERANQDVQNMMMTWMQSNESTHWAESLRFIQFMKNRSFHQGIHQSPYEAMFGCTAKVGLSTSNLPKEIVDKLVTEEDLEKIEHEMETAIHGGTSAADNAAVVRASGTSVQSPKNSNTKVMCPVCEKECSSAHTCESCGNDVHAICGVSNAADEGYGTKITCWLCHKKQEIRKKRSAAHVGLQAQASKMLKNSDAKFPLAKNWR
ncbi:SCAN domain-containing protein 3-like [Hyperolius riggenbachi]|uniref:SCAN domain-containing protein 3-like n=1 Tax=Hyperolius riggenbachi TaxID=752182 RepID=UPI0035A332E3